MLGDSMNYPLTEKYNTLSSKIQEAHDENECGDSFLSPVQLEAILEVIVNHPSLKEGRITD
jgi:hypothetical protein